MVTRFHITGFVLALCLLSAGTAYGQGKEREKKQPALADIERRLDALEKLLEVVSEDLRAQRREKLPASAPTSRVEVHIYTLKSLDAAEVARTLKELLSDPAKKMRIVAFKSTNSVLVLAGPQDLDMVATIIAKLEDQPLPKPKAPAGGK